MERAMPDDTTNAAPAEPTPSATVVLIRDRANGLELLLLQRSPRRDGAPGPWVFPGGKVEDRDIAAHGADAESHARRAAVRETLEEASLAVPESLLVPISRWITPEIAPRRFDTWFFLGHVDPEARVQVDGAEMCAHRWIAPGAALAAHESSEIRLAPPTFVTVTWLREFSRCEDAIATLGRGPILTFRPRICAVESGACILYPGDAGYDAGQVEHSGPRHRLWSLPEGWRYERTG